MKKMIAFLILVSLALSLAAVPATAAQSPEGEPNGVWAEEPTPIVDFEYKVNVYDKFVAIEEYIGTDSTVWVPASYKIDGIEYDVRLYGDSVFAYNDKITSAIFDEGITDIPASTFSGCDELRYLYLPSTMGPTGSMIYSIEDSISTIYFGGSDWEWYVVSEDVSEDVLQFIPVYCNSTRSNGSAVFAGVLFDREAALAEAASVTTADAAGEADEADIAGAWAADYTPINNFLYELDKDAKTITLIRYDGSGKKIALSPVYTIDGVDYRLVSLGDRGCFYGETSITSVYIPEGVEYAGANCFNSCSSLRYLYIPSTMKSVTTDFLDYLHNYAVHFNATMHFRTERDIKDYAERADEIDEYEEAGRDVALAANAFIDGFFEGLLEGDEEEPPVEIYFGGTEEQWDNM